MPGMEDRPVFRRSRLITTLRDLIMAKVSAKLALRPIQKLLGDVPLSNQVSARDHSPAGEAITVP